MYWSGQDKLSSEAQNQLIDISDWFAKKTMKRLSERCRRRNSRKMNLSDIRHLIKEFALLPDEVVDNERLFYSSISELLSFEEKQLLIDFPNFDGTSTLQKDPWGFDQ